MLDTDREPQQVGGHRRVGALHARTVLDQTLDAAERGSLREHAQRVGDGTRAALASRDAVDAFSTAVVGIGIGLSPFVSLELALILVVLYLTLSINVYLETHVFGVFKIGYGWLGPTEVRIILTLANAGLALGIAGTTAPLRSVAFVANIAVAFLVVAMLGMLTVRFGKNLSRLAKIDPRKQTV